MKNYNGKGFFILIPHSNLPNTALQYRFQIYFHAVLIRSVREKGKIPTFFSVFLDVLVTACDLHHIKF